MQNSPWPAYQPKKSTLVTEWVVEQIRSQVYPEGTKLPSEREIAQPPPAAWHEPTPGSGGSYLP